MLQNKKCILYCCNNTICIKFLDVLIKTLYFILTHLIKNKKDCKILTEGLDYICKELRPNMIFFYGSITIEIKSICEKYKIPFKIFKPQISQIFGGKNGA